MRAVSHFRDHSYLLLTTIIPGDSPITLCLIIPGIVLLILGAFYEVRTSRDALFPPILFNDLSCGKLSPFSLPLMLRLIVRIAVVILIVVFLHSFAFTAGTYYISLYFQASSRSSYARTKLTEPIRLLMDCHRSKRVSIHFHIRWGHHSYQYRPPGSLASGRSDAGI
jgi:hypothetical protein